MRSLVPRRLVGALFVSAFLLIAGVTPPAAAIEPIKADFDHIANLVELTDDHARVLRLYWAYFDRQPEADGAMYWIDQFEQCRGLLGIATFFTDSPEFVRTYGELTNNEFIDLVYRNVLDRSPDSQGRAYWAAQLQGGSVDRTRMMVDFSFSPEFVGSHPLPSDGVPGRVCAASVGAEMASPQTYELQDWVPYATVGPVTLVHPSAAVGQIGFHQSGHDGAQQQTATDDLATPTLTMASRGRGTASRSASDIAVHPLFEIRSPVSGTVLRAGSYILYCDHRDDFVVIEPDDRPGWEVKVLHISGVQVRAGDTVEAGVTVLAPGSTKFSFRSQIDKFTAEPSWGHVHIEIVDPSIPDRPSTGPGC